MLFALLYHCVFSIAEAGGAVALMGKSEDLGGVGGQIWVSVCWGDFKGMALGRAERYD